MIVGILIRHLKLNRLKRACGYRNLSLQECSNENYLQYNKGCVATYVRGLGSKIGPLGYRHAQLAHAINGTDKGGSRVTLFAT